MDDNHQRSEQLNKIEAESMVKTKAYIDTIGAMIKNIKKLKPKDRLDHCVAIQTCLQSMLYSLGGWNSWLQNLFALGQISEEEFEDIFPKIQKLSTEFLEIDKSITLNKLNETMVKIKERSKRKSDQTKPKTPYRV